MNTALLRRYRLRLIGGMVALLLIGGLFLALRPHGPDPRLEAIRHQGYPATLTELDAWYRPVPETQNVALVYMKALGSPAFTNLNSDFDPFTTANWRLSRGKHLAPEDKAELSELLSTNKALLHPLYAAPGPCRYPVRLTNGFNTLLEYLPRCKTGIQVLLAAAVLHADSGAHEQAFADMAAAAHLSDSLAEEPMLVSQLVRLACWNAALQRLEILLNLGSWTDQELARWQKLIEPVERPRSMVRAMAGERAFGLDVMVNPGPWLGWVPQSPTPPSLGERLRATAFLDAFKLSGFYAKDRAFFLDVMATNVAACELPFPEKLQAGRRASTLAPPGRFYIFSSMLLPALGKAFTREADVCARQRAALTTLAIQRFRLAHTNALPNTLDDLVPAYLACVPASPFDDKPLHYKLRRPGYVVYCPGADGIDRGGLEAPPKTPSVPHDITFILEK